MKTTGGRVWMKLISRDALRAYMTARQVSVRELSIQTGGRIKPAIIGHLRSGLRDTCSPTTAAAIEKALRAPAGSLFIPLVVMPKVSRGSRSRGHAA